MSGNVPPDSAAELPDHIEDALADALLRAPRERKQRLDDLIGRFPGHAPVLRRRIAECEPETVSRGTTPGIDPSVGFSAGAGGWVGRYKLLEQIAEGGMGTIWMAEQREPIKRRVAVKVIKLGMDTKQVMARFDAERQALAMMDHPHIAKVFDAGSTESGRPYFVMEYIRGVPILEYCDLNKVGTQMRLELFMDVCQAIQHAHQKGVIHRDIKPSNVLVTLHDGEPVPKVIDFGIAKATSGELTEKTLFTAHRQMVGTPAYMSPEQAEFSGLDVDTRSDIYSLGVLLYELLTGTTPFDNEELLTKGFVEMVRTIREVEPPKPSTRISTLGGTAREVAALRRADAKRLGMLLRGDLDWIVMKCLEKDRRRRYDTASDLAADIRRHLDLEPVLAGAPSASYRFWKFVQRNRGRVVTGTIVGAALIVGLVVSGIGWSWALEEKRSADAARVDAELVVQFLRDTLKGIGPSVAKGRDITMLEEMMDAAAERIERGELAEVPEAEVRLRGTIGSIYSRLAQYDDAERMLKPALELARSVLAGDHPETAAAMTRLATLYYYRGKLAAAEPLHREALEMNRRLFPGDDRRVANAQTNLAILLQARGQLPEAEKLYRGALAMNKRLHSGDHASIAWVTQALATLLSAKGDSEAAEPLYREALAMNKRLYPGDGPQVATSLGHMAIVLHDRGDLEAAEQYYRDSLAMNRRLFPGDHTSVATGLNALAMLLRDRDKTEQATQMFIESMEMSKRLHPSDPNRAVDQDALASLYWEQRRFDRSIPLFEEVLAAREEKYGIDHAVTLTTLTKLAVNYKAVGRVAEALPLLEKACGGALEHTGLGLARSALLDIYAMSGTVAATGKPVVAVDVDKATALVVEMLAAEAAGTPATGLDKARRLSRYADALLGLQQWGRAEALLRESLAIRKLQEPEAWQTFRCAARRGRALLGSRRLDEAESLLLAGARGLLARKASIPVEAISSLREACGALVEFYERSGKPTDAATWRRRLEAMDGGARPSVDRKNR